MHETHYSRAFWARVARLNRRAERAARADAVTKLRRVERKLARRELLAALQEPREGTHAPT